MAIAKAGQSEAEVRYTTLSLGEREFSPAPGDAREALLQRLHRLMTREMFAAELLARNISEYPDMPWEFMLDTARICWDEVRHAEIQQRRLEEFGGAVGMYPTHPVDHALYQHRVKLDLAYRLCDLGLLGEGPLQHQLAKWAAEAEAEGDALTAHIYRYIHADEKNHVPSSLQWLKWLTGDDVDKLHRIIERGKKLRAEAGLVNIPVGD